MSSRCHDVIELGELGSGGGATAGQGSPAQPEGQLLGSRPPPPHVGHAGAGRGQPHGPPALCRQPAEAGERGKDTHVTAHTNTHT